MINLTSIKSKLRPIYHFFKNFRNTVLLRNSWGHMSISAQFLPHVSRKIASKIYLYENTVVLGGASFIINPKAKRGNFILKKYSGISSGLTVITGNHSVSPRIGTWGIKANADHLDDEDKDVVVEEDVWIGAKVTLTAGVTIGRGSIVGAGSVIRNSVPPYSIVIGNPAKVIGFKYTPEEVIEHEKKLYPEEERYSREILEKNYNKYFINRIKDIREYTKI